MLDHQSEEVEKDGFRDLLVNREFIDWLKMCEAEAAMLADNPATD